MRVRKAFYQAIDVEAIKSRIMRGNAVPTALLIYPPLFSRSAEFKRHPYDPAAAKKLLAEAGYPNGFALELDCSNDRYVNDEAICQAIVAMLARVGVKAKLNAMPKARYFDKVGAPQKYDSSFLSAGPQAREPNILRSLAGCATPTAGRDGQLCGYCNLRSSMTLEFYRPRNDTINATTLSKASGSPEECRPDPLPHTLTGAI